MPKGANGVPYDPFAITGADHWYNVGAQRVRAVSNDLANRDLPAGLAAFRRPGLVIDIFDIARSPSPTLALVWRIACQRPTVFGNQWPGKSSPIDFRCGRHMDL